MGTCDEGGLSGIASCELWAQIVGKCHGRLFCSCKAVRVTKGLWCAEIEVKGRTQNDKTRRALALLKHVVILCSNTSISARRKP